MWWARSKPTRSECWRDEDKTPHNDTLVCASGTLDSGQGDSDLLLILLLMSWSLHLWVLPKWGCPPLSSLCPNTSEAMCGKTFKEAIWSQLDWVRRSLVLQWGLWWPAQTAAELCKRPRQWGEDKRLLAFQRISSGLYFLSSLRLLHWRPQFSQVMLIIHLQGQGQYHRIWALSRVIKISLRSRQLQQQQQQQLPRLRPWKSPELHIKRGLESSVPQFTLCPELSVSRPQSQTQVWEVNWRRKGCLWARGQAPHRPLGWTCPWVGNFENVSTAIAHDIHFLNTPKKYSWIAEIIDKPRPGFWSHSWPQGLFCIDHENQWARLS